MFSSLFNFKFFLIMVFQVSTIFTTLTFIPSPFNSIRTFIYDLGTDSSNSASMAQVWTFENLSPTELTRTSPCSSFNPVGGLSILTQSTYVERTYKNLPSHTSVDFSITILTLDDWGNSDFLSIQIDGATVTTFYPKPYLGVYMGDICGDSSKPDMYSDLIGQLPHTADSLTMRITASLSSTSASFGIHQLFLMLPTISSGASTALNCPANSCQYSQITQCPIWKYLPAGGGSCTSCSSSCYYCWGSASNQCYVCAAGYSFNGGQCIHCPSNCKLCTSTTQCDICSSSSYVLDTDKTCKSACSNTNAIIKGTGAIKFCVDPCPTGQRMLWDYTCTSTCDPPLIPVGSFCNFPCDDDEYLYPNGTCAKYCSSPYLTEIQQLENFIPKYCSLPCGASGYLYEDGSCHLNCPQSMIISTYENEPLIKTCLISTEETEESEETKEIEKIVSVTKTSGTISKAGLAIVNILSPSNIGSITSGSLQQMLLYLRYLNISQTPSLEYLFNELGSDSMDFIPMPNMPQTFTSSFPSYSIPYMFAKYDLSSSFIVNYGDDLISWLIWTAAFLVPFLLDKFNGYLRNISLYRRVIKRSKIILQNYALGQFYELFGEIIFFSVLDIRANEQTSEKDTLDFVIIIICLIFCLLFLILYCWVLHRYQKLKSSTDQLRQFKHKFEGFQLFYEDFVDTSFTFQGFLFFDLMRIIVFYLVIALMTANPIPQIFMLILLNMCILTYLIYKRPLESKIELAQQISFELIFTTANVSFLVMAFTDRTQHNWTAVRKKTSQVIIVCNVIFTFLPIAFMAIKMMISTWEFYHWFKEHLTSKAKISPSKFRQDSEENMTTRQASPNLQVNINAQKLSFLEINNSFPPLESIPFQTLKNKKKIIKHISYREESNPRFTNRSRAQLTERSSFPLNTQERETSLFFSKKFDIIGYRE